MYSDLHLHTKYSDGKLSVEETVREARKKNIELLSITDHDSIEGVSEAVKISRDYDITCISGMELSCRNENNEIDFPQDISIHILAYNLDYENEGLKLYLKEYHYQRKRILLELLNELSEYGFDTKYEDISVIAGSQMRIQDIINHINSSFVCKVKKEKYIKLAKSYYKKLFMRDSTLNDAIGIIKNAGGIPVLAHAFFSYRDYDIITNNEQSVSSLISYLCELGIEGIEVFYSRYNEQQIEWLFEKAQKNNLMVTAGSDFHGTTLRKDMMDYEIPRMNNTIERMLSVNRYVEK